MKITKAQKKMMTLALIAALAFLIFVAFIYLPLKRQLDRLKGDYGRIESEVAGIKKMAGEGRSLEESIAFLKNRYDALNKKFPPQDEIILREISGVLARLGIETSSLRPQKKTVIKEIGDSQISIKGCLVQEMPISISLKAPYKKLGEFFRILKEDLPVYVRVDSVRMRRTSDSPDAPLDVELEINSYLITNEGA